jgi:hypothetical protein
MKIYLAGPYYGENVIEVLSHIRQGISAAANLIRQGHAVYCPFLDFLIALMPGEPIPKHLYQSNSMAFVEWADAILLLPGWEGSGGTAREIARARELNISVGLYDDVEGSHEDTEIKAG